MARCFRPFIRRGKGSAQGDFQGRKSRTERAGSPSGPVLIRRVPDRGQREAPVKKGRKQRAMSPIFPRPKEIRRSRPISRVLSWTIIHLGLPSPAASSNLPESTAGHGIAFLFGLAPGGVYHAAECCHLRGALLPHHFTLTSSRRNDPGRYIFCCTFRRLAPPRSYLAPCPVEPGLSSPFQPKGWNEAIAWPAPEAIFSYSGSES